MLEFVLSGTISALTVKNEGGAALAACMDFLQYLDKYNMGFVGELVTKPLGKALRHMSIPVNKLNEMSRNQGIREEDIELVFRISQPGSKIRKLIVSGALSYNGLKKVDRVASKKRQSMATPQRSACRSENA
ncbi:hypothetical protein BDZ45DRAFT_685263 [Acephala macrosclerotiorum]|nr:hypothetical protein BDZ45DRAFT_685263 [Acephala macrosclerotiorum]